ncbi:MAG: hypothetical protein HKN17_05880, partial [Rhodothermales bacterium]|nr:hypothetical protein [Rhodothermales bacterium]
MHRTLQTARSLLLVTILLLTAFPTAPSIAQTVVFQEAFDGVVEPDLPASVLSSDASWTTSSSSASTGSGGNNLRHAGTASGDVVFGPIDLQNASGAVVTYVARRTSSYPADSLTLSISVDGGGTWTTLMGPGAALPEASSEYQTVTTPVPDSVAAGAVIRLRFRGFGGSSSGSNIRLDDITVAANVDLSGVADTFGFSSGSSSTNGSPAALPLDLMWTGPDSIQGLQFDVDFDNTLLAMTAVAGGPSIPGADWTIDHSSSGGTARVLLLGGSGSVIAPGEHAAILTLEFSPTGGSGSTAATTVSIRDLIVASNDPGGSNLDVVATPSEHQLTIELALPSAALSSDSLLLGTVAVGASASGTVTVSNPSGEADLVVSDVSSTSSLFSADQTAFTVPPGGSVNLELSYAPTPTDFGAASAVITLSHNAAAGTSQIAVSATGTGGRGDVSADGAVDVGDVVAGIDAVLERTDPAAVVGTLDMYPFPSGDGNVDVRDLTVLVHAILNGVWPDDVPLPSSEGSMPQPGKASRPAIALSGSSPAGTALTLEAGIALRGVQVILSGLDTEPDVMRTNPNHKVISPSSSSTTSFTRSSFDPGTGRFVLLDASSDVVLKASDRLRITGLPAGFEPEDIAVAIGIGAGGERIHLSVTDRRETGTETPDPV